MKFDSAANRTCLVAAGAALAGISINAAATEPCDDFGECKALIEINSTDGDIGFHFLMDGDDLNSARIFDPNGKKVWANTNLLQVSINQNTRPLGHLAACV